MSATQPKFSIIVCSVKPEMAEALSENVSATIGVDYEMIIFDNRQAGKGICEVYNQCAERAVGEYLLFVHEDVAFHTEGWGRIIGEKLRENSCGVIGFAGSAAKYGYEYGWQGVKHFTHKNYIIGCKHKGGKLRQSAHNKEFMPVVCLDGMCLFVRREVWTECRFDAETFRGFHSYDTDFTTHTHQLGYTNYVCHMVSFEHFSLGSFSAAWYESVKLYLAKWGVSLPVRAEGVSEAELKRYAVASEAIALKRLVKARILSKQEAWDKVRGFAKRHPLSIHSLGLIVKYISKYANK